LLKRNEIKIETNVVKFTLLRSWWILIMLYIIFVYEDVMWNDICEENCDCIMSYMFYDVEEEM